MPIRKTSRGYKWGSRGPFKTRAQAERVAQAAYASGYRGVSSMAMKPKKKKKSKKRSR